MKIRLVKRYQISPAGTVLNSVPTARAMRMIENGIAEVIEDKKGPSNAVANNKKRKRRASKSG